jgi:hypothetical protein
MGHNMTLVSYFNLCSRLTVHQVVNLFKIIGIPCKGQNHPQAGVAELQSIIERLREAIALIKMIDFSFQTYVVV